MCDFFEHTSHTHQHRQTRSQTSTNPLWDQKNCNTISNIKGALFQQSPHSSMSAPPFFLSSHPPFLQSCRIQPLTRKPLHPTPLSPTPPPLLLAFNDFPLNLAEHNQHPTIPVTLLCFFSRFPRSPFSSSFINMYRFSHKNTTRNLHSALHTVYFIEINDCPTSN